MALEGITPASKIFLPGIDGNASDSGSDGTTSFDTKGNQDTVVRNMTGITFSDQDNINKNREYNLGEVPAQVGREYNGSSWDIVKDFAKWFPKNDLNQKVFSENVGNRLNLIS